MVQLRQRRLPMLEELLVPAIILAITVDALGLWLWDRYDGIDATIYAAVAALWSEGWIPYRDVYDFKPPLIYALFRLGWAIWPVEPDSLRKIFVLLVSAGSLLSYVGLRAAGRGVAGTVSAVALLTLFLADPWRLPFQNTEMIAVGFGAAAFGCAAAHQASARLPWAIATGFLLALAVLGKQPAIFYAIPLGLQLALPPFACDRAGLARFVTIRALCAALGSGFALVPILAYFGAHHALDAMWSALVNDGFRYTDLAGRSRYWHELVGAGPSLRHVVEIHQYGAMWPFIIAVATLLGLTVRSPDRWCAVAWAWIVAGVLAVAIGPRDERHYVMFMLPALAVCIGFAAEGVMRRMYSVAAAEATRPAAGIATAVLLFATIWGVGYMPLRHRVRPDPVPVHPLQLLGDRIHAAAEVGDTLEVVDEQYLLFVSARVPPVSPHFYRASPNPLSQLSTEQRIGKRARFLFLETAIRTRLEQEPEGEGFRTLSAEYVEWIRDPVGSVYRRISDEDPCGHIGREPSDWIAVACRPSSRLLHAQAGSLLPNSSSGFRISASLR